MLPTPTLVMGIVQRTLGKWLYVSDEIKDQLRTVATVYMGPPVNCFLLYY